MKRLLLLAILCLLASCSVEQRIKDHSYTEEWYTENGIRYQVYKTRGGKRYIIVFTKNQNNLKRKYIKKQQ
jgi:hypothetical protein